MKLVSISMAFMMLMAIILRSLPDSVFNYFHNHTHISYWKQHIGTADVVEDYQHNCHIEDWNFESFELVVELYRPIQHNMAYSYVACHSSFTISISIPQQGRAPPVA
jgi:hypothetical protein